MQQNYASLILLSLSLTLLLSGKFIIYSAAAARLSPPFLILQEHGARPFTGAPPWKRSPSNQRVADCPDPDLPTSV